ncbi:FAD-dependent urate hydroxylase [Podospora conica]|nr:FAD-dependent urate hydroxylase [Schizothecium conicum]
MPDDTPQKVLIIGAGIAGLTLAQCLRKHNIPFTIYERDASPTSRDQGFALGLYDLLTLLTPHLPTDLPPLPSTCHLLPLPLPSQVIYHLPPPAPALLIQDTPTTPCLRANRQRLRALLSTYLSPSIHYAKHAISITTTASSVTVHFSDGTSATGTLLVGADGVHSSVRPFILKKPNTAVLTVSATPILGEVTLRGAAAIEAQLRLGYTGFVAFGAGFTLFSGVNRVLWDEDHQEVVGEYYWVLGNLEGLGAGGVGRTKAEMLAFARDKVGGLREEFRGTVEATGEEGVREGFTLGPPGTGSATVAIGADDEAQGWYDALIPGDDLPPVDRVLLIGDACHPMTPNRGEGGIFAIRDAVQLSQLLAENVGVHHETLRPKLDSFQKDIADKGHESILAARDTMSKARTGAAKPKAWGHELTPITELPPLPFKLADWRPE